MVFINNQTKKDYYKFLYKTQIMKYVLEDYMLLKNKLIVQELFSEDSDYLIVGRGIRHRDYIKKHEKKINKNISENKNISFTESELSLNRWEEKFIDIIYFKKCINDIISSLLKISKMKISQDELNNYFENRINLNQILIINEIEKSFTKFEYSFYKTTDGSLGNRTTWSKKNNKNNKNQIYTCTSKNIKDIKSFMLTDYIEILNKLELHEGIIHDSFYENLIIKYVNKHGEPNDEYLKLYRHIHGERLESILSCLFEEILDLGYNFVKIIEKYIS